MSMRKQLLEDIEYMHPQIKLDEWQKMDVFSKSTWIKHNIRMRDYVDNTFFQRDNIWGMHSLIAQNKPSRKKMLR